MTTYQRPRNKVREISERWRKKATPSPTVQQARHDINALFMELVKAWEEVRVWRRITIGLGALLLLNAVYLVGNAVVS